MISLPILERIEIDGYGLYPGTDQSEGLKADFLPGLTLVLGTNGLGKTTLVRILYRLLTGPYDIPGLDDGEEVGNKNLEAREFRAIQKRTFGDRVVDMAANATATIWLKLGGCDIEIKRKLNNISLVHLKIDGIDQVSSGGESVFQRHMSRLCGVPSFGDWILVLRHLTFYFEDRRALIWDPSAQRQLLRLLFLPESVSIEWTKAEREILRLDSETRNESTALSRAERELAQEEAKVEGGEDVRARWEALLAIQAEDESKIQDLETELFEADDARRNARRHRLTAEQAREGRYRELERDRLKTITTAFPSRSETALYIMAQLMEDHDCLVCGSHRPEVAKDLKARAEHGRCVLCGSDVLDEFDLSNLEAVIASAEHNLESLELEAAGAMHALEQREKEYSNLSEEISSLYDKMSERAKQIHALKNKLPPGSEEVEKAKDDLRFRKRKLEEKRAKLGELRESFSVSLDSKSREINTASEEVKDLFDEIAKGFLFESCELVWSPQRDKLGETGEAMLFPAYQVNLSGTDFPSLARRTGPEQVSESQREFIDLSFRMALMRVATNAEGSTLVVDAPESSLDGVFSERAADVLSAFANDEIGNRLILTSNMIEGELIPKLVRKAMPRGQVDRRLVNLLRVATPTMALRKMRSEYEELQMKLLRVS